MIMLDDDDGDDEPRYSSGSLPPFLPSFLPFFLPPNRASSSSPHSNHRGTSSPFPSPSPNPRSPLPLPQTPTPWTERPSKRWQHFLFTIDASRDVKGTPSPLSLSCLLRRSRLPFCSLARLLLPQGLRISAAIISNRREETHNRQEQSPPPMSAPTHRVEHVSTAPRFCSQEWTTASLVIHHRKRVQSTVFSKACLHRAI